MADYSDIGGGGGGGDAERSFSSSLNSNASSKAVLSALKALQEKIRRLESERAQALEETAQIRSQMKTLEIEANHSKQREGLVMQKGLQEARTAYDRLLTEKTELEIRLNNVEIKNRDAAATVEEQLRQNRSLEAEKHAAMLKVKELESTHSQLESQMHTSQLKEKDLMNSLTWEHQRHQDEIEKLSLRLTALQEEHSRVTRSKQAHDNKISELDTLVANLVNINEALVAQLSGKTKKTGAKSPLKQMIQSTLKGKSSKGSKVGGSGGKVATKTTSASRAATVSKKEQRQFKESSPEDLDHLRNLHDMYSNIVQTVLEQNKGSSGGGGGGGANSGLSNSRSVLNTSQSSIMSSRTSGSKVGFGTGDTFESKSMFANGQNGRDSRDSSPDPYDSVPTYAGGRSKATSSFSNSNEGFGVGAAQPKLGRDDKEGGGGGKKSNANLNSEIAALENEFSSLKGKYKELLGSSSVENDASQAHQLTKIISQLHSKGAQLRALQSPGAE